MAVKHQVGGGLDATSADLVVSNRLADCDYTVVASDELQLTALEAVQVIQRGKRPNHATFWNQLLTPSPTTRRPTHGVATTRAGVSRRCPWL